MCVPRCVSCNITIDTEDSDFIALCEDCYEELIREAEKEAYKEGFKHAIELLEEYYKKFSD